MKLLLVNSIRVIIDNIKSRRSKASRGYSLIEIILAISIFSIFSYIITQLFITITSDFKSSISESRESFYLEEACRYIETELNDKVRRIEVSQNIITLKRFGSEETTENPIDYIKHEGGNIVIKYSRYGNITTNNIITNIEDFTAYRNGNIIFISLTYKGGKRIERCIGLSNTVP